MSQIILKKNLDFENKLCNELNNILEKKNPNKTAVVFDIDDTLIFTNKKNNQPIKKVYDTALKLNIPIFIVTARILSNSNYNFTLQELMKHGFGRFKKLFLMPIKYLHSNQIGLFKYHARQLIRKNHDIIMNIGDQWTDLFPNPSQVQRLSNDYYIFYHTSEGTLVKLKSRF